MYSLQDYLAQLFLSYAWRILIELTCKIWSRAVLRRLSGGLNKLLEALVVDV
jgi:hypothetical protein